MKLKQTIPGVFWDKESKTFLDSDGNILTDRDDILEAFDLATKKKDEFLKSIDKEITKLIDRIYKKHFDEDIEEPFVDETPDSKDDMTSQNIEPQLQD